MNSKSENEFISNEIINSEYEFQKYDKKNNKKILDITEYKLKKLLLHFKNKEPQEEILQSLLNDYYENKIEIAWKDGEPIYRNITLINK